MLINSDFNMPPIIAKLMKDYLEVLQDKETQICVWTGQTDLHLDYVETMCGLFDDTGFTTVVEDGEAKSYYGERLTEILLRIDEVAKGIDDYDDPIKIANSSEMEQVRLLSKEALKILVIYIAKL